jgi:hypothetical protein
MASSGNAASIPGWKVLNFDVDQSVSSQKQTSILLDDKKDLHSAENSIRLWTGARGLKILRGAVSDMRGKYPEDKWLSFEGSGDLHQVAATLIETLPKPYQPVTVIQIDNHPDWFNAPEHFHCGAWVVQALKHPWVEKVIMIGQNSSDIRGDQFRFAPFGELRSGRVEMHPLLKEQALVPFLWSSHVKGVAASHRRFWGTELKFDTVRSVGAEAMGDRLARELAGKNVYISLDKDVMGEADALTDWDQGQMTLKELLTIIGKITASANLVGMDICGERAPQPLHGLLKRIDSGRLTKPGAKDFEHANQINEKTNVDIIKFIERECSVSKNVSGEVNSKPAKR